MQRQHQRIRSERSMGAWGKCLLVDNSIVNVNCMNFNLIRFSYGYNGNQNGHDDHNQFYFSKPQFQQYPYSQQDIPATSADYAQQHQQQQHEQSDHSGYEYPRPQRLHTTVEIQRSHGYEIKPEEQEYRTIFEEDEYQRYVQEQRQYQQHHGHHGAGEYENAGPLIVLRIPGPTKYATHLQALLQQYLEVRAAQYIQALQEEEARGQSQQYLQQQQQQPQQELSPYHAHPHSAHDFVQQAYSAPLFQAHPEQSVAVQPLAVAHDHETAHEQAHAHAVAEEHAAAQAHAAAHEHAAAQQQALAQEHAIAQEQAIAQEHEQHVQQHQSLSEHPIVYHSDEEQQQQHQQQYQDDYDQSYQTEHKELDASHEEAPQPYVYERPEHSADHLLTHENYPDDKHTRVIFKSTTEAPQAYLAHHDLQHHHHHHFQEHQQYLQETTAPEADHHSLHHAHHLQAQHNPHSPLVYQHQPLEQYYGSQDHFVPSHGVFGTHTNAHHVQSSPEPENYVTITQRPHGAPYNYHAHPIVDDAGDTGEYEVTPASFTHSAKRQAHFTVDQMQKFSALMSRMQKKMHALRHGQATDENRKR